MAILDTMELSRLLWAGKIPVQFSLDASEVTTLHPPRPFYAMIPRMSYLVCETQPVIEYFRDAAPPMNSLQSTSIWFEHNGVALKWHIPFGALFDLMGSPHSRLPWHLVVHFTSCPSHQCLPCENEKTVEMHFMHCLKQSVFLRFGSTKTIMSLPEAQQTRLWQSVKQNDLLAFQDASRDLNRATEPIRHLPIRVLLQHEPFLQLPIKPGQNCDVEAAIQRRISAMAEVVWNDNPTDETKTLGELLSKLLPDLFPLGAGSSSGATVRPQVLIHGLDPPMDLDLPELVERFVYPDGFLYISVLVPTRNKPQFQ